MKERLLTVGGVGTFGVPTVPWPRRLTSKLLSVALRSRPAGLPATSCARTSPTSESTVAGGVGPRDGAKMFTKGPLVGIARIKPAWVLHWNFADRFWIACAA